MSPKVSIVILNYNGFNDTVELLESLRNITYPDYQIIVIDNNSSDNDVERFKKKYKDKIQIFACKENLGYSGGNNIGIRISLEQSIDYILILNNDTIVKSDFLEKLIRKFELNHKVGIVAPQINYYREPLKVWSLGGVISKLRGSGFAESNLLEAKIKKVDRPVSFVSGCCLLVKKEVFDNVGFFDENFFLYVEDTDFCYRVLNSGYKIYSTSETKIYHKVKSTTAKNSTTFSLYYETRNRLYFAKKHFLSTYLLTVFYISTTMLVKSFFWFTSGKIDNIYTVKNAFKDFFQGNMGKRKQ